MFSSALISDRLSPDETFARKSRTAPAQAGAGKAHRNRIAADGRDRLVLGRLGLDGNHAADDLDRGDAGRARS